MTARERTEARKRIVYIKFLLRVIVNTHRHHYYYDYHHHHTLETDNGKINGTD